MVTNIPVQWFRGENTANKFLEQVLNVVKYCRYVTRTKFNKPLKMTDADVHNFQEADEFQICGKKYSTADKRVANASQIIVIINGNTVALLMKLVIWISNNRQDTRRHFPQSSR